MPLIVWGYAPTLGKLRKATICSDDKQTQNKTKPLLLRTSLPFTASLWLIICEVRIYNTQPPSHAELLWCSNETMLRKSFAKLKGHVPVSGTIFQGLPSELELAIAMSACVSAFWLPMLAWATTTSDGISLSDHYLLNKFPRLLFSKSHSLSF